MKWEPGFSIITGETGAGKSILLGALSLILGQRADTNALKEKNKKCVVEGVFNIRAYELQPLFHRHELDYDDETILRREISASGKSRAFINDTPVNLKTMRELGLRLVDIHSQHQNLELGNQQFQLMVLDICAQAANDVKAYQQAYKTYREAIRTLNALKERAHAEASESDYHQFQYDQLEKAELQHGEQQKLEEELELLNHAEEIKVALNHCYELLNGENRAALSSIKEGAQQLEKITAFLHDSENLHQRLESAYLELKDIAEEAEQKAESIEYDPARLAFVNERLDLLYSLQQKHHVDTVDELISLRDQLEAKLQDVASFDEAIATCEKQLDDARKQVIELGQALSLKRTKAIPEVEKEVNARLTQLGMLNAKFVLALDALNEPGEYGLDNVSFLFSANKNGALCELSKVASGGEMSRLMLSLKSLISKSKALPTIIFDEIDTGISGEIAGKMGTILKEMSSGMQVINITHLPQVAAKGDSHYWVYKKDDEHETHTHIRRLDKSERVEELAKMLSGENVTAAALKNAEELLQ